MENIPFTHYKTMWLLAALKLSVMLFGQLFIMCLFAQIKLEADPNIPILSECKHLLINYNFVLKEYIWPKLFPKINSCGEYFANLKMLELP